MKKFLVIFIIIILCVLAVGYRSRLVSVAKPADTEKAVSNDYIVVGFSQLGAESMSYVLENKIACIAECNPLHGPRVQAIIDVLESGGIPEKYSYVVYHKLSC